MHSYEEKKAEIFYKNNYEEEITKNDENIGEKEQLEKCESSSLSSLE